VPAYLRLTPAGTPDLVVDGWAGATGAYSVKTTLSHHDLLVVPFRTDLPSMTLHDWTPTSGDLVVTAGATVTGTVLDPGSAGLVGATVSLTVDGVPSTVATTTAGVVGFVFGLIPLFGLMLFTPSKITIYLLCIPFIAGVQFIFTQAFALLVAAGNVFFRDLGNVMRHVLRLWFYLSPGLYSLTLLENVHLLDEFPILRTLLFLNPFAILFEAYRTVIWGTSPNFPPSAPDWAALAALAVASTIFLALATVVFKRLEPNFAKVL
jgi:hypothetical protein